MLMFISFEIHPKQLFYPRELICTQLLGPFEQVLLTQN